ncbi:uncharacterized protein LOC123685105 isoform X1 [Harmonia axyridis]|uniref:uncharacterized protein LOC123685105 isoform X1 n=1 Tax=Harmonia axyridis TaxID=115357 RepID=UPI001E277653|nr:uncharacterized protein LOC123685105 isoform X1 [Harmonia axyridis]
MKNIGFFDSSIQRLIFISIFTPIIELAFSLECIYCPTHSTEDECKEMDMTQICINETKCGYARFIEEKKDIGELYPHHLSKQILSVTVKKGCMDEDYCTKLQQKRDTSLESPDISTKSPDTSTKSPGTPFKSPECIFCEEDLCILQFPILCVECNEVEDKYCPIKTEPFVSCPTGEVCSRQMVKAENYTQKRGCMDPARCQNDHLCEYCNNDICWTDPIKSPFQKHLEVVEENKTMRAKHAKVTPHNNSDIQKLSSRLIIIVVVNLYVVLI